MIFHFIIVLLSSFISIPNPVASFAAFRRTAAMAVIRPHQLEDISLPALTYVTPSIPPKQPHEQDVWLQKVKECGAAGVSFIQLRDKASSTEELIHYGHHCRSVLKGTSSLFIINGDIAAAEACEADGIHLPEARMDLMPDISNRGKQPLLVGVSVHGVASAIKAARLGADYLQVGTMFLTQSHPEKLEPEGPGLMREIDQALKNANMREGILLCGIGGITERNCGLVIEAGADGVAAINAIASNVATIQSSVQDIREEMQKKWKKS